LVALSGSEQASTRLEVGGSHEEAESLSAKVGRRGVLGCDEAGGARKRRRLNQGTVNTWLAAILDDNRGRLQVGGRLELVDACLR
jgi:hypothetical protein